jgi:hypothetical protein
MRIIATLDEVPDPNLVGLSYFVEDGIDRVAIGEVESVQDDSLVLYCTAEFAASEVLEAGRLRYNAAGTERAIKHQEVALDSIQSGDVPNPSLASLVSDPSKAAVPAGVEYESIVPDIDEDKQRREGRVGLGRRISRSGPTRHWKDGVHHRTCSSRGQTQSRRSYSSFCPDSYGRG